MPDVRKSVCIDRGFHLQQLPGGSFEEARAIVLGRFVENELAEPLLKMVRLHLERCQCCTQFVDGLNKRDTLESAEVTVPYAVCPSSEALDRYVFHSDSFAAGERTRLTQHLRECPLCREEAAWAKNLEPPQQTALAPSFTRWPQYAWVAAGFALFVLSMALIWQRQAANPPAEQLRALAIIKQPEQINYDSLNTANSALTPQAEVLYRQAVESFRKHDFEDAASGFQKVLTQEPHHSASLYLLAYTYYWLNEPEKAFLLCERAETVQPHAYERCMSLVNIALKTGHFGRAVQEITALYHEAPQHPEIRTLYFSIMKLARGRNLTL